MPLYATLHFNVSVDVNDDDGGGGSSSGWVAAAEYSPRAGTSLPSVWSASVSLGGGADDDDGGAHAITLYRLRALTQYDVKLWLHSDRSNTTTLAWSGDFESCATGVARLDRAPFVVVDGARPSFEMASFATATW